MKITKICGVGLCLLALDACHDQDASVPPPALPVLTKITAPQEGAYTGAYIDFGESEDDVTLEQIEAFEKAVGKHQAIIASSSYWGQQTFPTKNLQIIARHGSIPLLYWSPWDLPYNQDLGPDKFSLQNILAGKWDAYIDSWADHAKAYNQPLLVAWGLEMNGTWFPWSGWFYENKNQQGDVHAGPETFKKAYRYVVDRVRARGARNILWVFHTNNTPNPEEKWNTMAAYYPGDDYVDWLGMSAYGAQFKDSPWLSPAQTFLSAYNELCALSPTKPVMLAEWGIADIPHLGDKSAWISQALTFIEKDMPRVKAAVFWNERWENKDGSFSNLRATSSPQSLEAYRESVARSYWLGNPVN